MNDINRLISPQCPSAVSFGSVLRPGPSRGGGKTVKPYQAPSLKEAPGIVLHALPPKILKAPLEFFKGEGPLLALESTNFKKIACGRPFYLT